MCVIKFPCILFFCLKLCLCGVSNAIESKLWEFDNLSETFQKIGKVKFKQPGPRPPEFPDLSKKNLSVQLGGAGARIVIKDPGENSYYDFTNRDEISITAWVKLEKFSNDPVYIIGKGRTHNSGFAKDNQNWALRVVGENNLGKLSFLFSTGSNKWHRWTSKEGFDPYAGWHFLSFSYRFGEPESVRAWIDSIPTLGVWDLNGPTTSPPVTDNDEVWIGSSMGGNEGNSFTGWLDEIRLSRKILDDNQVKQHFNRMGGPKVVKWEPPRMPEMGKIRSGQVLVQILDGLNSFKSWPANLNRPKPAITWDQPAFILPRIPLAYDSWGIRSKWKAPLLLRMAADISLPAGETSFLTRVRGMSRLWVDGKEVVSTKPASGRRTDGHNPVTPLATPPKANHRVKGYHQQEAVGTVSLIKGGIKRIVFEQIVGGTNQRTETGETLIAIESKDGKLYHLLTPISDNMAVLNDKEVNPILEKTNYLLTKLESNRRKKLASSQDEIWQKRREIQQDWLSKQPSLLKGTGSNTIEKFISEKLLNLRNDSGGIDDLAASAYHILEQNCFRCHGNEKKKGGLDLSNRQTALLGGESEIPSIVPQDPMGSEIMARIISEDEDLIMPPSGDHLSKEEIDILGTWIQQGANWKSGQNRSILKVPPLSDDYAFIRRVYFDTLGLPPTPNEIRNFVCDQDPQKRAKIIDKLIEKDEVVDNWMGEWLDLLAENPSLLNQSLNSTGPFRWFVYESLIDRKPLDRMVTELILMRGDPVRGGSAGFGQAAENDAPFAAKAHIIASSFLGVEMECARCHDAPYHSSTQRDLFSLSAMLERKPVTVPASSRVPASFFQHKGRKSLIEVTLKPNETISPTWSLKEFIDPTEATSLEHLLDNKNDSRERLAMMVTSHENKRFAKVIVNRIWKRLMGAGIVEPAHDWEGNQPSHPDLLDWLAIKLIESEYDPREIYKLIMNSESYQRQAVGKNSKSNHLSRGFLSPDPRRLSAEQVVDTIHYSTNQEIDSETLTFVFDGGRPLKNRNTLGKPTRAWMMGTLNNSRDRPSLAKPKAQTIVNVMKAFGWTGTRQKPIHEREKDPNVLQAGILANGTLVSNVARVSNQSFLAELALNTKSAPDLIENIFLRFLGRLPNQKEQTSALELINPGFENRVSMNDESFKPKQNEKLPLITWFNHLSPEATTVQMKVEKQVRQGPPVDPRINPDWRERYEDLIWSLINHREFVWLN